MAVLWRGLQASSIIRILYSSSDFFPFHLPSQSLSIPFFILHRGELISLGDIENIHKKRKHDKESRLETVIVSSEYSIYILDVEFSWSLDYEEITDEAEGRINYHLNREIETE